jgi:hypothetical protein
MDVQVLDCLNHPPDDAKLGVSNEPENPHQETRAGAAPTGPVGNVQVLYGHQPGSNHPKLGVSRHAVNGHNHHAGKVQVVIPAGGGVSGSGC